MSTPEGSAATPPNASDNKPSDADFKVIDTSSREVSSPSVNKDDASKPKVDAPAPAATAPTSPVVPPNGEDEGDGAPGAKPKQTAQDRIDELTRQRRDAERNAAYWQTRAEELAATPKPAQPPAEPVRPKRDDYQTDEAYQDALIEFGAKRVVQETEKERTQRMQQQSQQEAEAKRIQAWNVQIEAAQAKYSDYEQVMDFATMEVLPHVSHLLMEHDQGGDLVYHLAKNSDLLAKLNNLTPAKAAFEIQEIAKTVGSSAPASTPTPVKTTPPVQPHVSSAPPPAQHASPARESVPKNLETASMDEYREMRKQQGARWAR